MNKKISTFLLYLFFTGIILNFQVLLFSHAACAEIIFIVNTSVEADSLPMEKIKEIYLGDMVKWSNGKKIKIAVLTNDVHKEFVNKKLGMTTTRFVRHWPG